MTNTQAYEYLQSIQGNTERKVVCKIYSDVQYGNKFNEDTQLLTPVYISKGDVFHVVTFHKTSVSIRKDHLHLPIFITMTKFKKMFLDK